MLTPEQLKEKKEIHAVLEDLKKRYHAEIGMILLIRDKGDSEDGKSRQSQILQCLDVSAQRDLTGCFPTILRHLAEDFQSRMIDDQGLIPPEHSQFVTDLKD